MALIASAQGLLGNGLCRAYQHGHSTEGIRSFSVSAMVIMPNICNHTTGKRQTMVDELSSVWRVVGEGHTFIVSHLAFGSKFSRGSEHVPLKSNRLPSDGGWVTLTAGGGGGGGGGVDPAGRPLIQTLGSIANAGCCVHTKHASGRVAVIAPSHFESPLQAPIAMNSVKGQGLTPGGGGGPASTHTTGLAFAAIMHAKHAAGNFAMAAFMHAWSLPQAIKAM
jgi:hypothetical protein